MPDFNIRPASEGDVPVILSFIRGLAEYENLTRQMAATEEALRDTLFGDNPAAYCIIARYDGEPAGFALYFYSYSTFLARPGIYLEDLFVKPEYRGRGIGKALLVHLARLAVERNCGRFEWAVLDWNEPSIRFYQSLGAKMLSEWIVNRVNGQALADLASQAVTVK